MDLEFAIKVHGTISPKRIITLLLKSSKAVVLTSRPQNAKTFVYLSNMAVRRRQQWNLEEEREIEGRNENENSRVCAKQLTSCTRIFIQNVRRCIASAKREWGLYKELC